MLEKQKTKGNLVKNWNSFDGVVKVDNQIAKKMFLIFLGKNRVWLSQNIFFFFDKLTSTNKMISHSSIKFHIKKTNKINGIDKKVYKLV